MASAQLVQVRGAMDKQGAAIAEQHVEVAMTGQVGADARQHWGQFRPIWRLQAVLEMLTQLTHQRTKGMFAVGVS